MGGRGVSSFSDKRKSHWGSGAGTKVDETLKQALGRRGEPESIAQAAKNANPHYSSAYSEYSENCQRAVVAYELRRRGYKVYAQPTYQDDTLGYVVHRRADGVLDSRWTRAFQHSKNESVTARSGKKLISNIEGKMAEYGNGARAVLQVQWKSGGGHVFNVEQQNGRTIFVDAQVNKRYTAKYVSSHVKPGSVSIVRTDNLRISERAKDSVTSRKY